MLSGRNFSICQHEINIFGLNPNPKCYLSGMLDNIWLSSLLLVTFILQSRYCVLTSEYKMHAEHMVNVGEFYFYQTSAETTKYIFNDGAGATKDRCMYSQCLCTSLRHYTVVTWAARHAPAPPRPLTWTRSSSTSSPPSTRSRSPASGASLSWVYIYHYNSVDCCNVQTLMNSFHLTDLFTWLLKTTQSSSRGWAEKDHFVAVLILSKEKSISKKF